MVVGVGGHKSSLRALNRYTLTMRSVVGRIRDDQFRDRRNFLVYGVNAIGCDPCGIVQDLQSIYPYEKTYTGRKRLYSLSRAVINSRDEPGSVILHKPPEGENSPHLLACVTQYGWGESIESNVKAHHALKTSRDLHYVEGLRGDTRVSRRASFQTCMKKVAILAMGHREVEKIVIPEGVGCRGRCDEEWQEHYLPWVQSLASRLQPFGIETILVRLSE